MLVDLKKGRKDVRKGMVFFLSRIRDGRWLEWCAAKVLGEMTKGVLVVGLTVYHWALRTYRGCVWELRGGLTEIQEGCLEFKSVSFFLCFQHNENDVRSIFINDHIPENLGKCVLLARNWLAIALFPDETWKNASILVDYPRVMSAT